MLRKEQVVWPLWSTNIQPGNPRAAANGLARECSRLNRTANLVSAQRHLAFAGVVLRGAQPQDT
jgi:hypothetical protein